MWRLLRLRPLTAIPRRNRYTLASVGAVAALFAVTIGSSGDARAATALEPCHGSSGVLCGTVHATLDRRRELPGTVSLRVEELPASGRPRGVLFLLAGGPGQAATRVFDLADYGDHWRSLFPGYTLVTFDPRGTGDSGALRCQSLEDPDLGFVEAMAKCADAVGPTVTAYSTRDHAEDIEEVRVALGAGKIALFGTSYGAKLAVAYALAHPKGVERVLLDSPLAPQQPDPYARSMLRSLPRALRSLCVGGFCKASPSLPAELAALANALQRKPLRKGPTYVDGQRLLSLALDADVNAGVRAQLATIVAEARRGRPGLMLRLASPRGRAPPDPTFSLPLYIATTCGDPTFPWRPETSLADREQAYDAAVGALPSGATGPFGPWAAHMGIAGYCSYWPPSGPGAPLESGPLPDVPALVLSGGYDMRTPTESAGAIARLFPRARLLRVPGLGHGVLVTDFSGCAERAVHAWLGGARPASCPAVRPVLAPVGSLLRLLTRRVTPSRALDGVAGTLRSAAAAWYTAARGSTHASLPGLHGGLLTSGGYDRFTLAAFSDVNGIELTGRLDAVSATTGALVQLQGTVRVRCRGGLRGTLTVSGDRLSGRLGGRRITSSV